MTDDDWTTLPVRESTRERVGDLRPDDAHSIDEFVNTVLDIYEGEKTPVHVPDSEEPVAYLEGVDASVDRGEVPSAEEISAAVVADLRASLPSDVADEVENRLR